MQQNGLEPNWLRNDDDDGVMMMMTMMMAYDDDDDDDGVYCVVINRSPPQVVHVDAPQSLSFKKGRGPEAQKIKLARPFKWDND